MLFPGTASQGTTKIYDDEGDTVNYDTGYTWTQVDFQQQDPTNINLTVYPIQGSYKGMPDALSYEVKIMFVYPPKSLSVNGQDIPYYPNTPMHKLGWRYIGSTQTIVINVPQKLSTSEKVVFQIQLSQPINDALPLAGLTQMMARAQIVKDLLDQQWGQDIWQEDYKSLVKSSTQGSAASDIPSSAFDIFQNFRNLYKQATQEVFSLNLNPSVKSLAIAQLTNSLDIDPCLYNQ